MQPKPLPSRGPLAGPAYQPPSAPPIAGPGNANPGGRSTSSGGEQRLQSSSQYLRTPVIRYSSRMRVGKLHPLRVTLKGADGESEAVKPQSLSGGFDPPIVVQVTVPGALVTPSHQVIPVSGGEANFMVQPMKAGRLAGAKVEFLSQGRKVSEVPVPMKANRGRLAKTLLWLGILLPFIINFFPSLTFVETKPGARPGGIDPDIVDTGVVRALTTPQMGGAGGNRPTKDNQDNTKGNDKTKTAPKKDADAPPKKDAETPPKKDAASPAPSNPLNLKPSAAGKKASLDNPSDIKALLITGLVAIQPPEAKKDDKPQENAKDSKTKNGETENTGRPPGLEKQTPSQTGKAPNTGTVTYQNEDAIVAWVRSKLVQNGYQTKPLQRNPEDDTGILSFPRKYEITQESNADWSTKKVTAIALYYCEPVLRFCYRIFIDFPKNWQFGDLILALIVLTVGAFVWLFTGPNRTKIKGAVMDIRLAGS